jgi:hypothetical protein
MSLPISTILGAALPVFLLLALGFGLRRFRILSQEAEASLLKLVVSVFYPCLFLAYIIGNPALKTAPNLVAAPLVGFFTTAGGFLVAYGVARWMRLKRGTGLRTFSFCNGMYNYGYIPIPVIMALFGDRETMGVLLVHNVGVEAALWSVGIMLISGQFRKGALRNLVNPPVLALAVALCVNATGMDAHVPGWLTRTVAMLGACSIPMGILLAGAAIADLQSARGLFEMTRIAIGSIAVRLGLIPAAFVLLAAFLPGLSTELRQVMVIQAAMPAAILPIVLARHYGGDPAVAVRVVLATTLASVVTMPLWIRFGIGFVF